MKVLIEKTQKNFEFKATNEDNDLIIMHGGDALEKGNKGFRPMQMLLASLGGCMSIDIIMVLQKQRQQVDSYSIEMLGERVEDTPRKFSKIILNLEISGDIKEKKLADAIRMSEEKYCSVLHSLNPEIELVINSTLV